MIKNYIKEVKEVTKKYIAIAKARWVAFKGSVKASIRDIKNIKNMSIKDTSMKKEIHYIKMNLGMFTLVMNLKRETLVVTEGITFQEKKEKKLL